MVWNTVIGMKKVIYFQHFTLFKDKFYFALNVLRWKIASEYFEKSKNDSCALEEVDQFEGAWGCGR